MRFFHEYKLRKPAIIICVTLFLAGCAAQVPHLRMDPSLQKDIRSFDGVQHVPLIRLCDTYGLKWTWDQFTKTARIEKGDRYIVLRAGSAVILVNGETKTLDRPASLSDGAVYVPVSFVRNNLGSVVGAAAAYEAPVRKEPERYAIRKIVVDAGHGGKDPGATGRRLRLKEKRLTLAISKRLKEALERRGIKIVMTRESDVFVSLPRRVEIANRSGADLFVSIHINASRSRGLNGFECYYLSDATDDNARALEAFENAPLKTAEGAVFAHSRALDKTLWDMTLTENKRESVELARQICAAADDRLSVRNRGIRSARFYVLKGARMPSVLVEAGYISNKSEEALFRDEEFLDKAAGAVAQGIMAYKEKYERTEAFSDN